MPWGEFDPQKVLNMVERLLGQTLGRNLVRLAVLSGLLWVIAVSLLFFFRDFIFGYVWDGLARLFGNASAVTLDNVDAIITVLVSSLAILIIMFVVIAWTIMRALKRRTMPQEVIDELSDLRAEGINEILNAKYMRVSESTTDTEKDSLTTKWNADWHSWREKVEAFLQKNATHSEYMSFKHLGVVGRVDFPGSALTNKHAHWLMFLSRQLNILDGLITKHQERL